MRLTVFDVTGRMAHFRKHFSTTTSMTYRFPPRTTIAGLVAAVLGMDRGSYHALFSSANLKVALQVLARVRVTMVGVNYLFIKESSPSEFMGRRGRTPVKLELVLPEDGEALRYRIFLHHVDPQVHERIGSCLRSRLFAYPPALGPAFCHASIEYVGEVEAEPLSPGAAAEVCTVMPASAVELHPVIGAAVMVEESVQSDFSEGGRWVARIENYLFSYSPVAVTLKAEGFRCTVDGREVQGVFM
ncbi:MAG: type I-B CRISPR-associated protein Cas5b [Thermofilum sp.]